MKSIRHRRNHAVAGVLLVLAALVLVWATQLDFVRVDGPGFSADLAKGLGLDIHFGKNTRLDGTSRSVVLGSAAVIFLFALLLLITRVRVLGLVWRLGALLAAALSALVAYGGWAFIQDPVSTMNSQGDTTLTRAVEDATRSIGLWDVTAQAGLFALTIGVVLAVVAVFVPAMRRTETVPDTTPAPAESDMRAP